MARKAETGKGGTFDTRPNPFSNGYHSARNTADYTEVPHLGKAIQILVEAGCAVILGRTRDGGALVVTVLDGETRHRTYCSNDVELQDAFTAIIDMYGES